MNTLKHSINVKINETDLYILHGSRRSHKQDFKDRVKRAYSDIGYGIDSYVCPFMVRIGDSRYRSRASVRLSAVVPSRAESIVSANPIWFGKFQ